MEYPPRTLVAEPFAHQFELIEKTLIEIQNQPASYYGRRRTNYQQQQQQLQQQHQQQHHQPAYRNYTQPQSAQQQQQTLFQNSRLPEMFYRKSGPTPVPTANIAASSHVPSIFDDKPVDHVSGGAGSRFSTFDPFANPMTGNAPSGAGFTSSSSLLGTSFGSGNVASIWGDSNSKSDAAVWG